MMWIVLGLAAGVLVYFLARAAQQYEERSAAAAREEIERLSEHIQILEKRIENLEAIASAESLSVEREDSSEQNTAGTSRRRLRGS